jgi:hypothetical protein
MAFYRVTFTITLSDTTSEISSREIRWADMSCMVEHKNICKVSVRKREEKMSLKVPRRRRGNNMDMSLTEIRLKGGD